MKKILFISTGGTIASVKTRAGLKPRISGKDLLLEYFHKSQKIADVDVLELMSLDSTNVSPRDWGEISQAIFDRKDDFDGFVIGMGTDTIHYTASALSLALQNIAIPVIITGSVLCLEEEGSDAVDNFLDAVAVAESAKFDGVYICFHKNIIYGTHAKKILNEATRSVIERNNSVISSINSLYAGRVEKSETNLSASKSGMREVIKTNSRARALRGKGELHNMFSTDVGIVKMFSGLEADILDCFSKKKAIIIETFAPGNIPFSYSNWLEKIEEFTQKGILVVIATQVVFGEVDMSKYEVGQRAQKVGGISSKDMTVESALVKCMWIFGNYPDASYTEAKRMFEKSYVGEIRED